jgi:hypothetical protein
VEGDKLKPTPTYIYAMLGGARFGHPSSPVTLQALVVLIFILIWVTFSDLGVAAGWRNIAITPTTRITGVIACLRQSFSCNVSPMDLAKPRQCISKTIFPPPLGVKLMAWGSLALWMLLLFAPLDLGMYWLAAIFALGLVYTVWRWPDTISIDELQIFQSVWCRPRVSMLWEEIASVEVSKSQFGDALVLRGRSGGQIRISALQVGVDVLIEEITRHTRIPCHIEVRRPL